MSQNRGAKCLFNYTMDGIQLLGITGYRHIPTNDEEQLKRAVRQMGPVTVMFKITPNFFSYRDGVYQGSANCESDSNTINHALLVIGFGTDNSGVDYWLVQNSWGTSWGLSGFAKISRGKNMCGIASCATFPVNITDPEKEPSRWLQGHFHDPITTGARCLDGTRSGLFFSKGWGDGKNKTVIHFDGGGWCRGQSTTAVAEDCYDRSFSRLGSTSPDIEDPWGEVLDYGDLAFMGVKEKDAMFYNWNRYFIIYCDGLGH